jgi:elongation factor P
MINANSVKIGNVINFSKKLCVVVKTAHTQPGKGGAFVQMELKDILTGTKYNERFRSEDKIDKAFLEEVELQFLYSDDSSFHFMNNETYEQAALPREIIAQAQQPFLVEEMMVRAQNHEGKILSITLPENVEGEIEMTDAAIKGQTVTSSFKPATLTNGVKIMVPPFINAGEKVIIKSADLTYVERAK